MLMHGPGAVTDVQAYPLHRGQAEVEDCGSVPQKGTRILRVFLGLAETVFGRFLRRRTPSMPSCFIKRSSVHRVARPFRLV